MRFNTKVCLLKTCDCGSVRKYAFLLTTKGLRDNILRTQVEEVMRDRKG